MTYNVFGGTLNLAQFNLMYQYANVMYRQPTLLQLAHYKLPTDDNDEQWLCL